MSDLAYAAGHPAVPMLRAMAGALAVLAVLGLTMALWLSASGWGAVVLVIGSCFMALFWGLLMWRIMRRGLGVQLNDLPTSATPASGNARHASQRGALLALPVGAALAVVLGGVALANPEDLPGMSAIVLGIALGGALWNALQARDIHRWERHNDKVVFTRRGGPRFAWTKAQARHQMVLVAGGSP